ncbi:hypothetical protein T05_12869 [Trichinella murrelli]|uniref:Uncharacterized protein n=1 Tax=Trichinella murrelli TaxID=144512 RepID=A0A0V0UAN5_9BILA|nr:hypothetical protein T05_12869 [Trichinella murrelli]
MRMDCCGYMFQGSEVALLQLSTCQILTVQLLVTFQMQTSAGYCRKAIAPLLGVVQIRNTCLENFLPYPVAQCMLMLYYYFAFTVGESGDQTGRLELFSNQTCPTALCLSFICDKMAEQLRRDPFAHRDQFRIAVVQSTRHQKAAGLENTTCEYRDERWGKMKSQASRGRIDAA